MKAVLDKGVLTVTVPRCRVVEPPKPRRVAVGSATLVQQ